MKCKRLLACMLLAALLVTMIPLSALSETYATVISFDVLHLRQGPSADSAILGKYRRGTRVEVLSTNYRNWVRVRTPDKQVGYMYKQYLSSFTKTSSSGSSSSSSSSSKSSSSGSISSLGTGFRYVKTGIGPVNFRKDANVNSKLLDQIQGGTIVWVISSGSVWSSVRYNGTLGWIKTKYLTKSLK